MFRTIRLKPMSESASHRYSQSLVVVITSSLCVTLVAIPPGPGQVLVSPEQTRVLSAKRALPARTDSLVRQAIATRPTGKTGSIVDRGNKQEILDLEPAVAQAELILAVRLVDVTETKIVQGGRNIQITEQYRFEPVRVLKGIFARESLLLTGQDLGIYRFADSSDRLTRGQLMLVLLGRQGQNYFNCNDAPTLGQSIPRLASKEDPLLTSVDVLISMTRKRDRTERVTLLRDGLKSAIGRSAAPLLLSMSRRALPASQIAGVGEAILPHLNERSPTVREIAALTLRAILDASPTNQAQPQAEFVKSLVAALDGAGAAVATRVAIIEAIGSAGESAHKDDGALARLRVDRPASTLAELAARLRALGRLRAVVQTREVAQVYANLPLDAPADVQEAAGHALCQLDPHAAATQISSRLSKKSEALMEVMLEIDLLGRLPTAIAAPELLKAWNRTMGPQESLAFANACAKVADARLVPAVSMLLDPRQWQIRANAIDCLYKIDTDEAASALWPHLDEETDLSRKLQLIGFLGRHGFRDGYSQAIEHLSQAALREESVLALAALREPRAVPELRRIWETSNDLAWNAAAIRALARIGQRDIIPRLLEIAKVPGDPLAPSALIGLGDLRSADALPLVREALDSRSDEMTIAATRASASLLADSELKSESIRDRLANLLVDVNASLPVRQAALEALSALHDPRLAHSLSTVARDANLEGTPLLNEVERCLSKRSLDTK
jgi:hypothetical protein